MGVGSESISAGRAGGAGVTFGPTQPSAAAAESSSAPPSWRETGSAAASAQNGQAVAGSWWRAQAGQKASDMRGPRWRDGGPSGGYASGMSEPDARVIPADAADIIPYARTTHVVWELTLACNLACGHCGSRAGARRPRELTTAEALDVVGQLAEAGVREVTLIGGEAYLRADWAAIAAAIAGRGMVVTMVTGGLGVTARLADRMAEAGVQGVSVSIDGMEATHDEWRGVPGSWRAAVAALGHLRAAGIETAANTQINRLSLPELDAIYDTARDAGVHAWQVQLTVPMGRAADRPERLLQPYELLDVFPRLAAIARRAAADGVRLHPGNNVGYFGPYEALLRGGGDPAVHWRGCQAGLQVLGLEADGSVKACPSLPTAPYVAGRVPETPLAELLATSERLSFNRRLLATPEAATAELTGYCAGCYYAAVCRGGCNWTAHVILGRRGDNPYCHHRALERQRQGVRERLVPVEPAPGLPFDHGRFVIELEPLPPPEPTDDPPARPRR